MPRAPYRLGVVADWQWPPVWITVAALCAYTVQAIAWPFSIGRDGGSFLQHYFDLFEREPVLPMAATYRMPLTSLWYGGMLEFPGAWVLEVVQGIGFVIAVACCYRMALPWGRRIAGLTAAAVIIHPWYGALYHRVDSDGVFAFVLIVWAAFAIATARSTATSVWIGHAALIALLVMARPAAQLYGLFALMPLLLSDRSVRVRFAQSIACASTLALVLLGYSALNQARYGFFGINRLTYAAQPFMRVLTKDRLVDPKNGPASRELAKAIEEQLLPYEPYRSLNMSVEELLRSESIRLYQDTVTVADRTWGWDSNYRRLRDVSLESIRANPAAFLLGTTQTFVHSLLVKHRVATPIRRDPSSAMGAVSVPAVDVDLIPHPLQDMWSSTPDGRYDWLNPKPDAVRRFTEQQARVDAISAQLPVRNGIQPLSDLLNRIGLLFTPMIAMVALAILGIPFMCVTAAPEERLLIAVFSLSMLILFATFAGQVPAIIQYRLPLDPIVILAGVVGAGAMVRGRKQLRSTSPAADAS